ncbi:uncharacterized protein N0V89_003357 [Didymosphaeria variabile]|uniref:Uncharacterized protein n=1 Tax=Didymosphaeria variabile TaxID=1932322 RepID=A0A9W8XVY8_9PLEO|nr:uncharacterized protein N0V89_003357 [Didymosphaeria variabile]KAJ4358773.1 hypothetical protein N0V89_003357 [Didymosphaeria variabile]
MDTHPNSGLEELRAKLDERLKDLLAPIDLPRLSRLPTSRFLHTALPNLTLIELVSASAFAEDYNALYTSTFHGAERERPDLIISRLAQDSAGQRTGLFPYRIIGLRGNSGEALGAAQFSVLLFPTEEGHYAVPYLQYIYIRPQNRRQDLSELLHTLVLAVATAEAAKFPCPGLGHGQPGDNGTNIKVQVPFTLFETEPPSHGDDDDARAIAAQRTLIHARSGSMALMLRRKFPLPDKQWKYLSAHVQPGLEAGDPPLTLIWVIRPNPALSEDATSPKIDIGKLRPAVLAAVYLNFRHEGFPEENIKLAESVAGRRRVGAEFCVMELGMWGDVSWGGLGRCWDWTGWWAWMVEIHDT